MTVNSWLLLYSLSFDLTLFLISVTLTSTDDAPTFVNVTSSPPLLYLKVPLFKPVRGAPLELLKIEYLSWSNTSNIVSSIPNSDLDIFNWLLVILWPVSLLVIFNLESFKFMLSILLLSKGAYNLPVPVTKGPAPNICTVALLAGRPWAVVNRVPSRRLGTSWQLVNPTAWPLTPTSVTLL